MSSVEYVPGFDWNAFLTAQLIKDAFHTAYTVVILTFLSVVVVMSIVTMTQSCCESLSKAGRGRKAKVPPVEDETGHIANNGAKGNNKAKKRKKVEIKEEKSEIYYIYQDVQTENSYHHYENVG